LDLEHNWGGHIVMKRSRQISFRFVHGSVLAQMQDKQETPDSRSVSRSLGIFPSPVVNTGSGALQGAQVACDFRQNKSPDSLDRSRSDKHPKHLPSEG
jgi:hypothetical protein